MIFLLFLFGLIIGSFLNVCIYRVPRGESILFPPSHCPNCKTRLKPWDLVPVISYLFLKGKCRYCSTPVSFKYPLVELLTGLVFALLFETFGLTPGLAEYLFFMSLLIVLAVIDLEHYRIPNKILLAGLIGWLAFLPFNWQHLLNNLIAGAIGLGIFLVIAVASRGGMGGGDIKLVGLMGLFLGLPQVILLLFISCALAAGAGILLILSKYLTRKDPLPFAPFLTAGALITLLWGERLIDWYARIIGVVG